MRLFELKKKKKTEMARLHECKIKYDRVKF